MKLQKLPPQDVINKAIAGLNPDGGTDMTRILGTAAVALRNSSAALKHIIVFTDGQVSDYELRDMVTEAGNLVSEGITVSVVATGDDATATLADVAQAGQGQFYPGKNLQAIPEIVMQEALRASRSFIVEGEFIPTITSSLPVVADLTETPPLLGYVATTARPLASTLMRISPEEDPLLAKWQVGLGTTVSWTSDASHRWSQFWADWDGYVEFWSKVVRDTFTSLSDGTTVSVDDNILRVRVEGEDSFGEDATAVAKITDPTLSGRELVLDRVGPETFVGELPVDHSGTYVVGTSVVSADGSTTQGIALAHKSYSREYKPTIPNRALMARAAEAGGGRVDITPSAAFDDEGLTVGRLRIALAYWLIPAAALLFVLAVIMSRLNLIPLTETVRNRVRARQKLRALSESKTKTVKTKIGAKTKTVKTKIGAKKKTAETDGDETPGVQTSATMRPGSTKLSGAEEDAQIIADLQQADEAAKAAKTGKPSPQSATVSALLTQTRDKRQQDRDLRQPLPAPPPVGSRSRRDKRRQDRDFGKG